VLAGAEMKKGEDEGGEQHARDEIEFPGQEGEEPPAEKEFFHAGLEGEAQQEEPDPREGGGRGEGGSQGADSIAAGDPDGENDQGDGGEAHEVALDEQPCPIRLQEADGGGGAPFNEPDPSEEDEPSHREGEGGEGKETQGAHWMALGIREVEAFEQQLHGQAR